MSFFSLFPFRTYDLTGDGTRKSIVDIFRFVDVDESKIDSFVDYSLYNIRDGERPDVVSQRLYKTPDYHWTFFIVNPKLFSGLPAWPKSYAERERYILEELDAYSALTFRPRQIGDELLDSFSGLDLSFESLRLTRDYGTTPATAKIHGFDHTTQSLWVYDVTNETHFRTSSSALRLTIDSSADRTDPTFISGRNTFIDMLMSWIADVRPLLHASLVASLALQNAQPGSSSYYTACERLALPAVTFNNFSYYQLASESPAEFVDADGSPVSFIDAVNSNNPYYAVTHKEKFEEEQAELSKIRVVRPDKIHEFVSKYKTLLNE